MNFCWKSWRKILLFTLNNHASFLLHQIPDDETDQPAAPDKNGDRKQYNVSRAIGIHGLVEN